MQFDLFRTRAPNPKQYSSLAYQSVLFDNCSSLAVNNTFPTEVSRNDTVVRTSMIVATNTTVTRSISNVTQKIITGSVNTRVVEKPRIVKRKSSRARRKHYSAYKRRALNNQKRQESDLSKYVKCQLGEGGLANKLFGVVSCYVIASLLNATIICIFSLLSLI